MENSLSPSVNKSVACRGTTNKEEVPEEESGWTAYLQDSSLLNQQMENSSSTYSQSDGSPSLLSDAASHAAWKLSNNNQQGHGCPFNYGSPPVNPPQKLIFKKKKSKELYYDDSLEDTASSPINSPKVSCLRQMDMNPRKASDSIMSYVGKGGGSDPYLEWKTDERNEVNFDGRNKYYIDLKRRGLCLVPFSMLANYFG